MAGGLELGGGEVARATDELALDAPRARHSTAGAAAATRSAPHAGKFRTATALLAAVALAAVAAAVLLLVSGRGQTSSAPWSDWSPPDGGSQGAQEIAARLAPMYRIDATNQLAIVTVVNTANPTAAAAAAASGGSSGAPSGLEVAVQSPTSGGQISLLSGSTIAYNLCGIGSGNCAIGVGTPSTARLLLLRREALELALYTFKYISSAQNVVAILPPGHTQAASTLVAKPPTAGSSAGQAAKPVDVAVLFVRAELAPLLQQPLRNVLPEPLPPTVAQMTGAPEAGLVEQVTARGLFSERMVSQQDGSRLLVLSQLPPQ